MRRFLDMKRLDNMRYDMMLFTHTWLYTREELESEFPNDGLGRSTC